MSDKQRTMTEEQEQWLTGFWEGDGCCGKYHDYNWNRDVPEIVFTQKDKSVLENIYAMLGYGHIQEPHLRIHYWKHCARLFELLSKHVVSKQSVSKINRVLETFDLSMRTSVHEPTIPWTVGFCDAEGCVSWDNNGQLALQITQKECDVLERLQFAVGGHTYSGHGGGVYINHVYYRLHLYGSDLRNLIPQILKHSHHEPKRQKLLTMIYALASGSNGVWGKWAKELISRR